MEILVQNFPELYGKYNKVTFSLKGISSTLVLEEQRISKCGDKSVIDYIIRRTQKKNEEK